MRAFVISTSTMEIQDFESWLLRTMISNVVPPKRGSLSHTQCLMTNDNSEALFGLPGLYRERIV